MRLGVLLVQVLQVLLFVVDNAVDIVFALETVVHGGQHSVAVDGQINSNDVRALVGEYVEETGVLVGETVVVLYINVTVVRMGDTTYAIVKSYSPDAKRCWSTGCSTTRSFSSIRLRCIFRSTVGVKRTRSLVNEKAQVLVRHFSTHLAVLPDHRVYRSASVVSIQAPPALLAESNSPIM
jgi:hypothetical protein